MLRSNAVTEVPHTVFKYFNGGLICAKALTPEVVIFAQPRNFKIDNLEL